MAKTAAHRVDRVVPPVPVGQWVISVLKRLRCLLADRPEAECPACGGDIRFRGDGRQEPAHFEPEVYVCGRHGRHAACGRHARPFRNGRRKRPVAAESQTQKNIRDTLDTTVIAGYKAR